jgi:GTP:adenosylcobinamide-phosphate guanylyltransferase
MNVMNAKANTFTGVVLAADRGPDDPVARITGAPCKSFVPVGGRAMVLRVLDALASAREIGSRMVCGPSQALLPRSPELHDRIASGEIGWLQPQETPSSSTCHVLDSLPQNTRILITTSDHALLRAEIVDYFCDEARTINCDVVVGLANLEQVMRAYPETRRTAIRLRDGDFCSCNLFAFLTPRARRAAVFWRKAERHRKKPWRVIHSVGWTVLLRYLLGRLSLDQGLSRISRAMNLKAGAVRLPFPEAAVDVDTFSDWTLVEKIVSEHSRGNQDVTGASA